MWYRIFVVAAVLAGPVAAGHDDLTPPLPADDPAIGYEKTAQDPVAKLNQRLKNGQVKLELQGRQGYLRSVLKALDIPVSSQVLVFSKTSIQEAHISPGAPRAIYHNDEVALSWVRDGDMLEITSIDPERGAIFYSLDQLSSGKPQFVRRGADCLMCHALNITQGVPGLMISSAVTDGSGKPQPPGAYITDHRLPLSKRFGGWYVTGTHGSIRHMGNVIGGFGATAASLDRNQGANITDLGQFFNTAAYLSPHSDIVSLMMLEHKTRMINLIIRAGWEVRLGRDPGDTIADLVKYMLFLDEAPLEAPVKGDTQYASEFSALGPRDKKGRSLREFDLTKRLLKYPCSPLIYSPAFEALPKVAKDRIYQGLWDSLEKMTPSDRTAIVEILKDTKPGLPAYWQN